MNAPRLLADFYSAYVCPEWTWIFVDHNVMFTFHIMALRHVYTKEDLKPDSEVFHFLFLTKTG